MAVPQFKNMNELTEYLSLMEKRIQILEAENHNLRMIQSNFSVDENLTAKLIKRQLPKTNLLSPGFLKRSFTVWGHFFVANLIIGVFFGMLYICFMLFVLSAFTGNINPSP